MDATRFCRLLPPLLMLLFSPLLQAQAGSDYPPRVKSIVEQRCMVCHGCYDAPCQLKLDALQGLQRGASKEQVYDGSRLLTARLTRLFEDAHSPQEWRDKGFYPVLEPEHEQAAQGIAAQMLELKRRHPLPSGDLLPDSFDLRLNRDQQCPRPDEFAAFASDYPLWGMPYGLPALSDAEHRTLQTWLHAGAPGVDRPPPTAAERDAIRRWETFFNGDSLKQQLSARYIYEHLFIASLYFADLDDSDGYYHLVRSRTPPGEAIDLIATRRPYDPPGVERVYYRLQAQRTATMAKRHMPYALDAARMQRWQSLFLQAPYRVSELPPYADAAGANPFVTFRELPQLARYHFMLDEAQFTIMGFIKGPVCRGQVALNVIDDHFWVFFLRPRSESATELTAEFLASESDNLRLPGGKGGLLVTLATWHRYAKGQLEFLKAKMAFIEKRTRSGETRVDLDMIWDGEGHNDNAALTVFRHNDSASVVKGLVGRQPKTAWVIDYSLLERIHYLLVAGFDVYGNVAHQLETRLYMDFLRMEGEQNFLFFLPQQERTALRDYWYRDAPKSTKKYVLGDAVAFDRDTDISYTSDEPKRELLERLQQRLFGADAARYRIDNEPLETLRHLTGGGLRHMPETAFVEVLADNGTSSFYSLLRNNGFSNNAQLFHEQERRRPEEDYLTVVKGFIGAYPNQFFQLPERELATFSRMIAELESAADYASLLSRYGVRRTAPWFWRVSDAMSQHYRQSQPREAGLFDYNRYENR